MRNRIFGFLAICLTLLSCNFSKNGIIAEIKNSTDQPIRNITFSSDENTTLEFDLIEPKESVEEFLDMTNNHNKGDGAYILRFERENGDIEHNVSGYYTNGGSLDRKVFYEIKKDTIITKFSHSEY